jgi:hypothetical protein
MRCVLLGIGNKPLCLQKQLTKRDPMRAQTGPKRPRQGPSQTECRSTNKKGTNKGDKRPPHSVLRLALGGVCRQVVAWFIAQGPCSPDKVSERMAQKMRALRRRGFYIVDIKGFF